MVRTEIAHALDEYNGDCLNDIRVQRIELNSIFLDFMIVIIIYYYIPLFSHKMNYQSKIYAQVKE